MKPEIQIWNLESYVKNSSHPEKSKIREKISKFSWGFFSKNFWLFSEYYFVFFCLKNLKPYVEKSSHPKRAIWTSLLPHCAISRFKFPFCKKKIKFDKSGLDFVILPVIIPVRKIIRKLFSRVYERSGTRGINRTASFRSAKTKTPTESTEQEPTQVCVNKSIQTKNVPLPTELPGTAARFFYHWGRQLKSRQNEGICGSTERSGVLIDVLSVMLTLRLAPKAVNKSGCKAGFSVGIGLCSPIPTITKPLR